MLLVKQFCICDFCHNKIEVILLMKYTNGYSGIRRADPSGDHKDCFSRPTAQPSFTAESLLL